MGGGYLALLSLLLFSTSSWLVAGKVQEDEFLRCMAPHKDLLYTPESVNYNDRFNKSIQNWRRFNSTAPRPAFIFVPHQENEIQAAILCSKNNGLQIRVKSNGHDYEALSVLSSEGPYVIIDLFNHRRIDIDVAKEEAWVETGATLGELYFAISQKTDTLGFPAGNCPSVGTGGHISGGGWGWLIRKYGLAADNVIDARLIDVNGRILTRETMGEDLFWAIRGGGGASFGVITAWKLKLAPVPKVLTWAKVISFNQTAVDLFHKWQSVAPTLPKNLFIAAFVKSENQSFKAIFRFIYLGPVSELLPMMNEKFPELGASLTKEKCRETNWIENVFINVEWGNSLEAVFTARQVGRSSYKAKSDYVQTPIPKEAVVEMWEKFLKKDDGKVKILVMYPQGGRMDEISSDSTPFPHRKGYLYGIEYMVKIDDNTPEDLQNSLQWMNDLHEFMGSYVSKNPRAAYINYRDLDIGRNNPNGKTSYEEAKVWGERYFNGNFERLAKVKSQVDPENFFRNEQSIPLFSDK